MTVPSPWWKRMVAATRKGQKIHWPWAFATPMGPDGSRVRTLLNHWSRGRTHGPAIHIAPHVNLCIMPAANADEQLHSHKLTAWGRLQERES